MKMIKYAIILATLAVMSYGQRPPYAGNVNRQYPEVINHYRPSTAAPDSSTILAQRFGDSAAAPASGGVAGPYDPFNDQQLLDQIATWPKERQPFWYINREQIKQQLGITSRTSSTTKNPATPSRR